MLGYPSMGQVPEAFAAYAAFAAASGAPGAKVTKPGQVRSAIRLAPGNPGPALADVNERQPGRSAAAE